MKNKFDLNSFSSQKALSINLKCFIYFIYVFMHVSNVGNDVSKRDFIVAFAVLRSNIMEATDRLIMRALGMLSVLWKKKKSHQKNILERVMEYSLDFDQIICIKKSRLSRCGITKWWIHDSQYNNMIKREIFMRYTKKAKKINLINFFLSKYLKTTILKHLKNN